MGLLETSCAATSEALSDRLEGELHGLHRLRIGRHLARCGRCRTALASLARLVDALRTMHEPEPAGEISLVEDVLARIREGSNLDAGG